MQKLSDGSYETSERFSEENVWNAWQDLIKDAETTLGGAVRK